MKRIIFHNTPIVNKNPYAYYEQIFTTTVDNINNIHVQIKYCDYHDKSAKISIVKRHGWHIGWSSLDFLTDEVTAFIKGETPMPKSVEKYIVSEIRKSEYFQRASKKKARHQNSKLVRQEWTSKNA